MAWEDVYYEISNEVKELGLQKEFDRKLKDLRNDEKYQYVEVRDRWQAALRQIKEEHKNGKSSKPRFM